MLILKRTALDMKLHELGHWLLVSRPIVCYIGKVGVPYFILTESQSLTLYPSDFSLLLLFISGQLIKMNLVFL